jgi:hypothetical protein
VKPAKAKNVNYAVRKRVGSILNPVPAHLPNIIKLK